MTHTQIKSKHSKAVCWHKLLIPKSGAKVIMKISVVILLAFLGMISGQPKYGEGGKGLWGQGTTARSTTIDWFGDYVERKDSRPVLELTPPVISGI